MSLRDQLRGATVGKKPEFRHEIVKVGDHEFEVRQPSVATRSKMIKKCNVKVGGSMDDAVEKLDYSALQVWSVIYCTFVPGTDERVFEDGDFNHLQNQPAGGFVDELGQAAMKLMNVDPEEDAKNSDDQQGEDD